jgi:hypothetical protein
LTFFSCQAPAGFFIIDPEFFGATSTQCLSGVGAAYVFYPDIKLKFLRIEPTQQPFSDLTLLRLLLLLLLLLLAPTQPR